MSGKLPLEGLLVTELGGREAVGICGNLLRHFGAEVIVVEPRDMTNRFYPRAKGRAAFVSDKKSLCLDPSVSEDAQLLSDLLARSDIVLTSSDVDPAWPLAPQAIRCDITAFGTSGPEAGRPASEIELQAALGMMHTTGFADGPPLAVALPMIGYLTGAHACAAILAARRAYRLQGVAQQLDLAMFDIGFLALNAFLAGVLTGVVQDRKRQGNSHPTTPAWNLFPTTDGHVLICAGSQSQWLKLCDLIGKPEFVTRFATAVERMANLPEIDAAIGAWSETLDTQSCVDTLVATGIAAGPIAPIQGYPIEANLTYRDMIRALDTGAGHKASGAPVSLAQMPKGKIAHLPTPGADKAAVLALIAARAPLGPVSGNGLAQLHPPLTGLRVLELGQYTTVPLSSRQMALLGAEVIKVEKPGGDESRSYPPRKGNRSEVYAMMNSSKLSIELDLQKPEGRTMLRDLLASADVMIENNKPGTLARYGLQPTELAQDYPQLVQCSVSGFGIHSIYGDRPGFDTVIQAMSGFMMATNPAGLPVKSGISSGDLMGSIMSLVATLAAIEQRETLGHGQIIDLSMQDVSCWITEPLWNQDRIAAPEIWLGQVSDGQVMIEADAVTAQAMLRKAGLSPEDLVALSRAQLVDQARSLGLRAESVNSLREATELAQTKARGLWALECEDGTNWPVLGPAMVFERTKALLPARAPDLDASRVEVLQKATAGTV